MNLTLQQSVAAIRDPEVLEQLPEDERQFVEEIRATLRKQWEEAEKSAAAKER